MKKIPQSPQKPTRIEVINNYIHNAKVYINVTQNAINNPTSTNFFQAQRYYEEWMLSTYKFLEGFDKKRSDILFGSPDGVHTSLNIFEQRLKNVAPEPASFSKNDNGVEYASESGVTMLHNIITSFKEKIDFLNQFKLEITGGILSNKNKKKIIIAIYKSGKIKTSINDQSLQKRKGSVLMKIIYKIREKNGMKLVSLSKEIGITEPNTSREITSFNRDMKKTWPLKEDVITNESGYCMNKDAYLFRYDDLNIS